MTVTFQEAVADALTTVRLVPRWKLDAAGWSRVDAALEALHGAVASGRASEVARASGALEMLGPIRLSAVGAGSESAPVTQAPPPAVLELVNTLVHPTDGWAQPADPQQASGR